MLFEELGLSAELLRAIDDQGYREATPIQQQAIPLILEGRDVLAGAQTGTGKTAAFTLPLLQRLQTSQTNGQRRRIRTLVLTPTRELAAQVSESVRSYGRHLPFRTAVIFGGVSIKPQISKLRKGVDIIVATPGRLLDHAQQRTIDLSGVEILVLDEADRMLDMGFIRDIRRILALMPKQRQNLLFSATCSNEISRLAADLLNAPTEIQVAPRNTTADRVRQIVHPVDRRRKRELLSHRIGAENWQQVLVFTRTKHGANRLAEQLTDDGLKAVAIHGNKTQAARTRALADFKAGAVRVLVATDIAARGLDIDHRVNCLAPGATTRMTTDLPGQDPNRPPDEPELVSPAVLFMCSDDAPTGEVIQAAGGRYSRCAIFANDGVDLGRAATYEDFMERAETVRDMSAAHEGRMPSAD